MMLAAPALTACGVVSSTPWFSSADAAGASQLREGVWRITSPSSKPCAVNEARPLLTWPNCAAGLVVRASDVLWLQRDKNGPKWEPLPYLLVAGDPQILQIAGRASAAAAPSYEYEWLKAARLDSKGRIVEARGWRVFCWSDPSTGGQATLYPGLIARESGDCTAGSTDALRAAARSSQQDNPTAFFDARWVRAGER
jgi:hypothetical protein